MDRPVISIVLVVDRDGDDAKGWDDLRATLRGLGNQDFREPFETLLVENEQVSIPQNLKDLWPDLKIVTCSSSTSYGLKNVGAQVALGEFVGVLDADCVPKPRWITETVSSLQNNPEYAVVSGRTLYAGKTLLEKICCLIDRAHLDRGVQGQTDSIAVNNSGFRKRVLREVPFPDLVGAFGERLHVESFKRSGLRMLFAPGMQVTHTYHGWEMEKDIRRNLGYATIKVRQIDPRIRFAGATKFGYFAIPFFVISRSLYDCLNSIRCGSYYGVPWYCQPLSLTMAFVLHLLEVPGMASALRETGLGATSFR